VRALYNMVKIFRITSVARLAILEFWVVPMDNFIGRDQVENDFCDMNALLVESPNCHVVCFPIDLVPNDRAQSIPLTNVFPQ